MAAGWNKNRKWSAEVKQRISEGMRKNHPMRGKHWSVEIREKMSEGHKRWYDKGIHHPDCHCFRCDTETRRKVMINLAAGRQKQKRQQQHKTQIV